MDPRLEEAVRRAREGDPGAFRTLAERVGPDLVRFLTGFLHGDRHAAHDMAQETFLRAWDARGGMESGDHFRRWCFRVARCKAVSWLRRRAPPGRVLLPLEPRAEEGRTPGIPPREAQPSGDGDDRLDDLRRALARLPPNYAGPVHLHYVQGYDTAECARLLGLKRTTVKMRLFRARRFLRREIHREAVRRRFARLPLRRSESP